MIADYLPSLLAAASIQAMGAFSPGPAVALVVGVAVSRGRGAALATAIGIAAGSAALAVAGVVGLAGALAGSPTAMAAMKLLGAGYLLWLAWGSFRRAARPPVLAPAEAPGRGGLPRLASVGFAFQVTNPKSLLVWVAVSAVSGVHGAPPLVLAAFVASAFLISLAAHGGWGLTLAAAPARAAYQRARRWVDSALGVVFGAAGIGLLANRS
jgi:threonine/homoserine/homoserine lactone efflux protein